VPSKDPKRLSDAIIGLLNDDKLRYEYANLSFKEFEENYSANIMTKKYEKLYLREHLDVSR
jgi:glycosyltransferase involved in cell wall biosynthesis